MKILLGILVVLLTLIVTFGVQVAILHYGWGLEPANWWVISFGFIGTFLINLIGKLVEKL